MCRKGFRSKKIKMRFMPKRPNYFILKKAGFILEGVSAILTIAHIVLQLFKGGVSILDLWSI